jgi:predicted GNAT family acetyltransferase
MSSTVTVTDATQRSRFEVQVDGELAGFAQYVRKAGRVVFTHTEIDPSFEGRGLGSQLAAGAFDRLRATGEPAVPLCPFIAAYVDRHPEVADLVDHELLARFEEGSGR